ncbi:NAD(P)-dependent oxidoreductase [Clostridium hydrogeniformans]|uniref:NAD(P)-dependent oxidoreductase n=1 Tax=Clostridium hydrogeniformans TaxID=349933 RepID=UPI00047FE2A4|nr:NAD(P)-dependent oxidoreductase [Clostridium hydrogeniformans]
MKIALIGGSGNVGSNILDEALERGHEVVALARDLSRITKTHNNLKVVQGDVLNEESLAKAIEGSDVVISAFGPKVGEEETLLKATSSLINAVKKKRIPRIISMGGAGSLKLPSGERVLDSEGFQEAWKPIAIAHSKALDLYKAEKEIKWTNLSPAALIEPGEKTYKYRVDEENLILDDNGASRISYKDYALAIIDELENPKFINKRFTVAY